MTTANFESVLPRPAQWALDVLTVSLSASALARGIDFIIAPDDSSSTLSAMNRWMSPDHLGVFLIALSTLCLISSMVRNRAMQALSNIALSGVFLVMGTISFFPVVTEIGWGWRAPVSYILGSAMVHWYISHEYYNQWVEGRGRRAGVQ